MKLKEVFSVKQKIRFRRRRLILKAARGWEEGWVCDAYRQLNPDETIAAQEIGKAFQKLAIVTDGVRKTEPL